MKSLVQWLTVGAVGLALGTPLAAGCGGVDGAVDADSSAPSESSEELGSLEEGLTTVDMLDCSICATARACCNAVNGGSYCDNFSAESCSAFDPDRQRTVKRNCLVLLRTTISAWRLSGRTPPPECHIPGE